ncbi:MAG: glycosyltransferase [Candidatus Aminicenantes bacterium]|nr:glycosyltransferase [Candidatus Aminicenantes bacterium]
MFWNGNLLNRTVKELTNHNHYSGISIIIITHNEEDNIIDCLDSLSQIDYPKDKYEIVVVDASTDSTPDIVSGYPDVKLIKSQKGFSQQRNTGWRQALFELIAFIDADTIIPPEYLKVVNRVFQKEKKSAALGGNAYPPSNTNRFGLWVSCVGHPAGGAMGLKANMDQGGKQASFVPGCNMVFRKKALRDVNGFDLSFHDGGEDVEISRRLHSKGYHLEYVPDLTLYHKPRNSLKKFIQWNIGVGVTKYNLQRPSLKKLILQPSFPLWLGILILIVVFLWNQPLTLTLVGLAGWIAYLITLYLFAKPFPHLLKQRKQIKVSFFSVIFIIPILIYIRQVFINIGQLKKWNRERGPFD